MFRRALARGGGPLVRQDEATSLQEVQFQPQSQATIRTRICRDLLPQVRNSLLSDGLS